MTLDQLAVECQNLTGAPWFNGEAYAGFVGYAGQTQQLQFIVADLQDLAAWLREEKLYAQADRARAISETARKAMRLGKSAEVDVW